jgi:hypothetical protein
MFTNAYTWMQVIFILENVILTRILKQVHNVKILSLKICNNSLLSIPILEAYLFSSILWCKMGELGVLQNLRCIHT